MSLLPNMRLLGLNSADEGRDWLELSQKIDLRLEAEGFDLAEETVVLEFEGDRVRVLRPVIGGLRELGGSWILEDRTGGEFRSQTLTGENWDDILDQVDETKFTLLLKRRMKGELRHSVEVVFSFF